jgi:predicted GIY-YIG superfamily endonuclease
MEYFVYIIKNKITGVLYKGQTNNLERRLAEHEQDRWKNSDLVFV